MTLEKKVLVVDDQLTEIDVRADWGALNRQGYKFMVENAYNGFEYTAEKVLERIKEEGNIAAVVMK